MRIVRAKHQDEVFYAILEKDAVERLTGTPYDGILRDGRK